MKAMNFYDGGYERPTLESFNLGFIKLNFLSGSNKSKKNNLGCELFTFLKFST